MTDVDYSNRELDEKFKMLADKGADDAHLTRNKIQNVQNVLELKIADNQAATANSLTRIEHSMEAIETQVKFTNGKVRKIIVAMIFLAGVVIGLGFTEAKLILPLLL